MSELKAYGIRGIDGLVVESESGQLYLKTEADKFISDLEESHKMEVGQLLILNREQANAANRLRDSMEQALRHSNYKRCLAMAEMCKARYDEEDAKENWCGLSWEYISEEMKYCKVPRAFKERGNPV